MAEGLTGAGVLPLEGYTVVELSQVLAGPFATQLLGDLGAEVIKLEAPGRGDRARGIEPIPAYFDSTNRNKRSVEIDLKAQLGREAALALLEDADVFVQSTKPGRIDDYGLGYDAVSARNPGIVYCAISGFGSDSPYEDVPAWDILMQGMSGIMSMTGESDGPPVWSGLSSGDIAASMYTALAAVSALGARAAGRIDGEYVEIPMLDSAISWLTLRSGYVFGFGRPYPRGNHHPNLAPFGVFEAGDDAMVIAATTDTLWASLCAALDRPDLEDDPRFATLADRLEHREALRQTLEDALAARSVGEWIERMHANEVPAAPIYDTLEVWDDPHVKRRGLHRVIPREGREDAHAIDSPLRFTNLEASLRRAPAALGEDTEELLSARGFDADEIEEIRGR